MCQNKKNTTYFYLHQELVKSEGLIIIKVRLDPQVFRIDHMSAVIPLSIIVQTSFQSFQVVNEKTLLPDLLLLCQVLGIHDIIDLLALSLGLDNPLNVPLLRTLINLHIQSFQLILFLKKNLLVR